MAKERISIDNLLAKEVVYCNVFIINVYALVFDDLWGKPIGLISILDCLKCFLNEISEAQ